MNRTVLLRMVLRIWIGTASLFSFLIGWVMLAHSLKPVSGSASASSAQAAQAAPIPTLAPMPNLDMWNQAGAGGVQSVQPNLLPLPSFSMGAPVFTTGGS